MTQTAFHITIMRRLDSVAAHSQGTGRLHMTARRVRAGRRPLGSEGGPCILPGREDTGLGTLRPTEQQSGQDPHGSGTMGSTQLSSALLRACPTEIVSRSSYSGLGRSSRAGTCWRAVAGSLVPWQECAECGPSPAWRREGAVTVQRPSRGSSDSRAGDGLSKLNLLGWGMGTARGQTPWHRDGCLGLGQGRARPSTAPRDGGLGS